MELFLNVIGQFSNVAGAIGGIVSAIGVLVLLCDKRKLNQDIEITLTLEEGNGRQVHLPLQMKRRDVTRAELLGRLGMLPMVTKGARFSLRFLSTPQFIGAINEVAEGQSAEISIPCTREEIEQFDL